MHVWGGADNAMYCRQYVWLQKVGTGQGRLVHTLSHPVERHFGADVDEIRYAPRPTGTHQDSPQEKQGQPEPWCNNIRIKPAPVTE